MAGRESTSSLRDFVASLVEKAGGMAEQIDPAGIVYVAPADVSAALGLAEFGTLGFSREALPESTQVTFEADWIERFGALIRERGAAASLTIDVDLREISAPGWLVGHGLTLLNAVYRLVDSSRAWTRYLLFTFRYTAISDEKREGLLQFIINLATSSSPEELVPLLCRAISTGEANVEPPRFAPGLPPLWPRDRIASVLAAALPPRMEERLAQFTNGMQRRLQRDQRRLIEYYESLRQQSIRRIASKKSDEERELLRINSIIREYNAKIDDLGRKYAMSIQIQAVQTLAVMCPVWRFKVLVKRRKGERAITMDWNPLLRKLEPPACEYNFTGGTARVVCDEALHLVSPVGHAPCLTCGKEYCRVCHPSGCPRCR